MDHRDYLSPDPVLLTLEGSFDPRQGFYTLVSKLGEAGSQQVLECAVFRADESWAMHNWLRGQLADLAVINEHRYSNVPF